jgi:hypothetical protein
VTDPGQPPGDAATLTAHGALAASPSHAVRADQRLVVFRLGELTAVRGPGLAAALPWAGRGARVLAAAECAGPQLRPDPQLIRWAARFRAGPGTGRTS